jgi:hypothetical protein
VSGVRIGAGSTYLCLLAVCAVLAVPAQARILIEPLGARGRALNRFASADPDLPEAQPGAARAPTASSRYHALAAVIGGLGLLAGGVYAIDHLPRPAPAGYTWIAWTWPNVTGTVNISPAGMVLPFEIVHQQPDTAAFKLEAEWLGTPPRRMAGPLALTVGPDLPRHLVHPAAS